MPFLQQSKGNTINGGNFIDGSVTNNYIHDNSKGSGIKMLLDSSLRQAIHNSNARDPPKCHPGTREEYIRNITGWGAGEWKTHQARAFWMRGAAGVGKSAIAQTCAERISKNTRQVGATTGQLGASFFFYRPNGWNDPDKFIPTIAYQLTTKYPAYRDLVDTIVLRDPLVLETTMADQFQELLVKPFAELSAKGQGVGADAVIIVDGLDECKTVTAQLAIIELVTTSILQQTTPFLWAFFSRPEPHIVSAFSSEVAQKVSWQLELPVSHDADSDIEAYLRASFNMIRTKYCLSPTVTWPSEDEVRQLVKQSRGLFVYPVTIIRYIGQNTGAVPPEERLRLVLKMGRDTVESNHNPFSLLDRLYMLIMNEIPKDVLPNTLSFLCLNRSVINIFYCCSILGLSLMAFHEAISNLHSVLVVTRSRSGMEPYFSFYHKSFIDFLSTRTRSGPEYYVNGPDNLQRCFDRSINFLYRSSVTPDISVLDWYPEDEKNSLARIQLIGLQNLFIFSDRVDVKGDILRLLSETNWGQLSVIGNVRIPSPLIEAFVKKIPRRWRSKIAHPIGIFGKAQWIVSNPQRWALQRLCWEYRERTFYVLGRGNNRALLICGKSFSDYGSLLPYHYVITSLH